MTNNNDQRVLRKRAETRRFAHAVVRGNISKVANLLETTEINVDDLIDVEKGYPMDYQGLRRGQDMTPLHIACWLDYFELAQVLVAQYGANAHARTKHEGMTPLHLVILAFRSRCREAMTMGTIQRPSRIWVEWLLQLGVDIDEQLLFDVNLCGNIPGIPRSRRGSTALHCAAAVGDLVALECLLEHGADIDAADEYGITALFISLFRDI